MDPMGDVALAVRDLEVAYGGAVKALRGVSLSVPTGAVVAVLGNNGAGKSTLMRAISGSLVAHGGAVTAGSVEHQGRELVGLDAASVVRLGVVHVPEGRRIFGDLTVDENLRAGGMAAASQAARQNARKRVHDLFPILSERSRQRAGLLSGGEQQMLAIGRALMASPQVLLLDEPSLGLAPQVVERIVQVIREINADGTTVVLVEQNAAMALAIADLGSVLEVGCVALEGRAEDLAATDEIRERYLGVTPSEDVAESELPAAVHVSSADGDRPAADLVVENLTVRFGGIKALSDVSFTVEHGTTHALIGPNGAGKSTCLNVLSGVYRASGGSVRYGGTELRRLRPHRIARLGLSRTFQNLALSERETVEDNLLVGRHRLMRTGIAAAGLRLPSARRERARHLERVHEIASILRLREKLYQPVETLSYGDRKRVELARALCTEPRLLLLDEPVAGMTHDESVEMAAAITAVRSSLGITVLVIEHDMTFVMSMADHVTVLDFGRRIASGPPGEVQHDPEVLRAYLGSAAA